MKHGPTGYLFPAGIIVVMLENSRALGSSNLPYPNVHVNFLNCSHLPLQAISEFVHNFWSYCGKRQRNKGKNINSLAEVHRPNLRNRYMSDENQWRNYVCGALRQDIEWRPHPFPFFPSLPSPPNSSTSFPSLSPSLPSLPLEVGPLKSS